MESIKTHNIRIKFKKTNKLRWISHLDLQRTFGRAIKRSGIAVWHTQGYNPRVKMVFALPMSVGTQSLCEFLDIKIAHEGDCAAAASECAALLGPQLPAGLELIGAAAPIYALRELRWAEYELRFTACGSGDSFDSAGFVDFADRAVEMLRREPLIVSKRTKSGEVETDISNSIRHIAPVDCGAIYPAISVVLSASSADYLNPEYLARLVRGNLHADLHCDITRTAVYLADGITAFE